MTNSFIAIEGDFLNQVDEVFGAYKYVDTKTDSTFNDWNEFNHFLSENFFDFSNREIALRGIWFCNGWTIICDPETVDAVDEATLAELSESLKTRILAFIISETSGTFGYSVYESSVKRSFLVADHEVVADDYSSLPEEKGLNINSNVFSNDIIRLAERFGVDISGNHAQVYTVKQLAYTEELKKELQKFSQQVNTQESKPWWKFW